MSVILTVVFITIKIRISIILTEGYILFLFESPLISCCRVIYRQKYLRYLLDEVHLSGVFVRKKEA